MYQQYSCSIIYFFNFVSYTKLFEETSSLLKTDSARNDDDKIIMCLDNNDKCLAIRLT
jgi:hypothetical protein